MHSPLLICVLAVTASALQVSTSSARPSALRPRHASLCMQEAPPPTEKPAGAPQELSTEVLKQAAATASDPGAFTTPGVSTPSPGSRHTSNHAGLQLVLANAACVSAGAQGRPRPRTSPSTRESSSTCRFLRSCLAHSSSSPSRATRLSVCILPPPSNVHALRPAPLPQLASCFTPTLAGDMDLSGPANMDISAPGFGQTAGEAKSAAEAKAAKVAAEAAAEAKAATEAKAVAEAKAAAASAEATAPAAAAAAAQ